MSRSETLSIAELASELSARLTESVEAGRFDVLSDVAFGQALASMLRFYAEKSQDEGSSPPLSGGNSVITATDAMIACTAILKEADIEPFELTLWRTMSSVLPRDGAGAPARAE
jgi:hypothetical protein